MKTLVVVTVTQSFLDYVFSMKFRVFRKYMQITVEQAQASDERPALEGPSALTNGSFLLS